ncbi:elongation factor Tu-like [Paramacrobiotus metropolitanus]|uniref:elongation factor Tu-like n=1 Tax=Paramacrobiotus metropolitanus TaxID=2943436 RepID=UPI002445A7CC|nr:elongation factor Tu-like [Paramacrobiotus metropolitanus]
MKGFLRRSSLCLIVCIAVFTGLAFSAAKPNIALLGFTGRTNATFGPGGFGAVLDKGEELLQAKYGSQLNFTRKLFLSSYPIRCDELESIAAVWASQFYYSAEARDIAGMVMIGPDCIKAATSINYMAKEWNVPIFSPQYDGINSPVIKGSALRALQGDPAGEASILQLTEALDTYLPDPLRDYSAPFLLPVESCFLVPNRGAVAVGTLVQGTIKKGDPAEILGHGTHLKTVVTDIQVFKQSIPQVEAGKNVGVLLRGIKAAQVSRGMILAPPGRFTAHNRFRAQIYFLTKHEGGRSKPIRSGYAQQLFSHTWDVETRLDLPPGVDMLMPGEHSEVFGTLLREMVLEPNQRFTVREANNQTVATGVITKLLPSVRVDRSLGKLDGAKLVTEAGDVMERDGGAPKKAVVRKAPKTAEKAA